MSGIYWLASYPKSGNTWVRVFVASLLSNSGVDINHMDGLAIASDRGLFDDAVGLKSSELTFDEVDALRPDAYQYIASQASENLFFKVHDAFIDVNDRHLLGGPGILGAVYIIRNPLDVAISFAEHIGKGIDECIECMGDASYCLCGDSSTLSRQLRQRLLTWSGHVQSWVNAGIPLHLVRYEDMKARPFETFKAAAAFLGLPSEPDKIRAALAHSDIEVLRRMEREHGFRERSPHAKTFFRRGTSGGYRTALSPEQVAVIIRTHAPVMRQFGYLDDEGAPIF